MNIFEIIPEEHFNTGEVQAADKYIEPGYDQPSGPILLANWNNYTHEQMEDLEALGCALEWSDEWLVDYDSSGIVRTSPDSYSWEPSYAIYDGEVLTIEDSVEAWVECFGITDYMQSESITPIPSSFNLKELGFLLYNDEPYQSGLHIGMNDDPHSILKELFEKFPNATVLFQRSNSQFYTEFEVYYQEEGE